jgi:pimeloyl-ACP methyl ester carboxylesterase
MQRAVAQLIARVPDADVTLVGYSGGGVLAMFVAEREPRVSTVVTIAANLDVAAWATQHGYSALDGSLDPADVPEWRATLRQIHYTGDADENVPARIAKSFVARVPGAELREIPRFDHRCCWVEKWPALLNDRAPPSPR